jgi:DUF1009 family protein
MEKEQDFHQKKRAAESLLLVGDLEKKMKSSKILRPVSVEEICTEGFDENSDGTVLRFVILHIRKAQLKFVRTFNAGRQSKWNAAPNLVYDRIITAADLSSDKGMCFCFIYATQKESDYKLQHFKMQNCGVGEVGEVVEPLFCKKMLAKSDVPILEHKLPLQHVQNLQVALQDVPAVPYYEDALPMFGTRFFLFKGVQLHVQNVMMEDPICTGFMCDRQEMKTAEGTSCGCLTQSDRCNIVLSCSVFVRNSFGKQLFAVRNFRSWVFTKLLCGSSLSDTCTKVDYIGGEELDRLREHMTIIVDYINSSGGWTVLGWFRVGMQQDAADHAQEARKIPMEFVAAETVTPHISRLCPTDVHVNELARFQMERKRMAVSAVASAKKGY